MTAQAVSDGVTESGRQNRWISRISTRSSPSKHEGLTIVNSLISQAVAHLVPVTADFLVNFIISLLASTAFLAVRTITQCDGLLACYCRQSSVCLSLCP